MSDHKLYHESVEERDNGTVKVPMSLVDLEIEEYKNKNNIKMRYVFKDRSFVVVLFTKGRDYILERGL